MIEDNEYDPKYKWLLKDKANELLDILHKSELYKSIYAGNERLKAFEELISIVEVKTKELMTNNLYREALDYLTELSGPIGEFIDYTWTLPKEECDAVRKDLLGRFKRATDKVADFSKL